MNTKIKSERLGISVIIPMFNREKFIAEAIESVINQQFTGTVEIIVSDDGSTDSSVEVALSFGDPVIVLLKPIDCLDQGVSGARNRGILSATQRYISFLDSDDFYLPGHLNKMAALMDANPEIGYVFSRTQEMKEINGKRVFSPWTRPKVTARDIAYPALSRTNIVHTNVFLFRREVFDSVGLFNQNYRNGEDGDMWMRISEQYTGLFSNHFGAVYRTEHGDIQLTANNVDKIQEDLFKILTTALERCHLSDFYDEYREFLIVQNIVGCKFSYKSRFSYYLELLKLLFKYPKAFLRKIMDHLYY